LGDHLNQAGLNVQLQSSQRDGAIHRNAYLTTAPRDWEALNRLSINPGPSRIHQWHGIVYCERDGRCKLESLDWEDHQLVISPFSFYGDAELLERIGILLKPYAAAAAP
jgi:hypothetical protein